MCVCVLSVLMSFNYKSNVLQSTAAISDIRERETHIWNEAILILLLLLNYGENKFKLR